ncbi:MAG: chemotaxis protein CheW [Sulfuritalea sp.]|jgi:purine-binding chemotaxis protein CheW|nr:chemotaxis protein CheW [Sulfuritalea sp.]
MDSRPLLIFDLDDARFAVDAMQVCESVWLPELTPVEEAPPWVVGLFGLRGRIIPVADLRLRFGHPPQRYSPSDQVVVLEIGDQPLGLIVSEVIGIIELPAAAIQPPPQFDAATAGPAHLVAGEARVGESLVTVLDVAQLTHLPEMSALAAALQQPMPAGHFCPEATPAERALFHARAMALRQAVAEDEGACLGLAVVELGGEYFGVELAAVQEFCDIAQLSPIPCCPPHILGAMNLRGDLLTLIDPRAALNLPMASRGGKAVVARLGEQAVGIAVDAVHDVVYLRQDELQPPAAALRERCGAEITGTAAYAGRTMTVLDLPALLAREDWIVNQHV